MTKIRLPKLDFHKQPLPKSNRAQAIVLIAVAFAGMVAMVGMLTDGGMLLIEYARLKRGVDAAAIGAAEQYRKNFTQADLQNSAKEFLQFNQSDVSLTNIDVETCDTAPGDPQLCTTPLRKLARVTATKHVNFGFLRLVGWTGMDISASAIGEAASVDLILVVDTSISMAASTSGDPNTIDAGDDPSVCNPTNTCQPMATVKSVAQAFADKLFYPYDRVAVISLTSITPGGNRDPLLVWKLQSTGDGPTDQGNVDSAIQNLKVFQPGACIQPIVPNAGNQGPCLNYPPPSNTFAGQECPAFRNTSPNDPTTCNSTNGGGGLLLAGSEFTDPSIDVRKDSFWAVVLLMSGTPNSSFPWSGDTGHPYGYCPHYNNLWTGPLCIQPSMTWTPSNVRHHSGDANYTSLDYAMDMADYVTSSTTGQGASIYSIGLGNRVENSSTYGGTADPKEAESFLTYAAKDGSNPGNYYYSPTTSGLSAIFDDIYKNITTRISE